MGQKVWKCFVLLILKYKYENEGKYYRKKSFVIEY